MSIVYQVTGGICPGNHRSTSVEVLTDDFELADKSICNWARTNFPDWNHISRLNIWNALITIEPITTIPIHTSKKR